MSVQELFSVIAGVLQVACFIPYILAVVRQQAKPMKATWLIWASVDTVTIAGMYAESAVNGQIAGAVVGAWVVFFLSLTYGVPGWTWLDVLCLVACTIGIVLWVAFNSPLTGIVVSSAANVVGAFPTIVSVWHDPRRENKLAWVMGVGASVLALMSITEWAPAHFVQPMAFLLIQACIVPLLFRRKVAEQSK